MGIQYNVLGIKGSTSFELTLGDKCNFITDNTLEINEIISEMTPESGANEVDVFTYPKVMFKVPVEKTFEITDINDNKSSNRIRVLDYTISYYDKPTQTISGKIEWNNTKTILTFIPNEMLPPKSKLKVRINVTFEECKYNSWDNTWKKVQDSGMETTFTTGKGPNKIFEKDIKYTYPVISQCYYHPGETKQAYVQLISDLSYLFVPEMKPEIRISSGNKVVATTSLTYSSSSKCIKFTMPALDLNTKYTLEILGYEKETNKESVISILKYDFTTSSFNTFRDKINGVNKTTPSWEETNKSRSSNLVVVSVPSLYYEINGGEPFESVELTGTRYTGYKALVSASATLSDNFYQSKIKPLLYEEYPLTVQFYVLGIKRYVSVPLNNRETSILGVPPVKAVSILTELERGINAKKFFPYKYNLLQTYYEDYLNLRNLIANFSILLSNKKEYAYLLESSFPATFPGMYEIELRYTFPNGSTGTSGKFTYSYK